MSIRILGGVARGFELVTPNTSLTRPTSVLLRRRFFDSNQDFTGKTFIDLCAGTGAMGLEALSRGAMSATLVESNKKVFTILKKNSSEFEKKYPKAGSINLSSGSFEKWLSQNTLNQSDTVLFFDPPYEEITLYCIFFDWLKNSKFKGMVVTEACVQKTMKIDEFSAKFGTPDKTFKQGTSFLSIYKL